MQLAALDTARTIEDMNIPGARLHPLNGELRGCWSITVDGNWRVTFEFKDGNTHVLDYGTITDGYAQSPSPEANVISGRNRIADNAWFCVLAATRPCTASPLRKASTSAAPNSRGCRRPLARMNLRIHPVYARSVCKL